MIEGVRIDTKARKNLAKELGDEKQKTAGKFLPLLPEGWMPKKGRKELAGIRERLTHYESTGRFITQAGTKAKAYLNWQAKLKEFKGLRIS